MDRNSEPAGLVRWGFAAFVASVALIGLLILVALVVVVVQPPVWVQALLGMALTAGAAALAWLIAAALSSTREI